MKIIATCVCLCFTALAFAQNPSKDTASFAYPTKTYDARIMHYASADPESVNPYQTIEPQVSASVVKVVANAACDCINKVNVKKLNTPLQRKNALETCLKLATNENVAAINADKNAQTNNGYGAGKKYGLALGKKLGQLLLSSCPAFKLLME